MRKDSKPALIYDEEVGELRGTRDIEAGEEVWAKFPDIATAADYYIRWLESRQPEEE